MNDARRPIDIIPYRHEYRGDFKRLNLEWLDRYGLTESHDHEMLEDPASSVLAGGGRIFLALEDGAVIGTAALLKGEGRDYELAKMSVIPSRQGRGIGRQLLECCIAEAETLGAGRIFLFSNTRLVSALKLYEKFGFKCVPVSDALFATADVKMELALPRR